jgi:hypothetical protein
VRQHLGVGQAAARAGRRDQQCLEPVDVDQAAYSAAAALA